MPSSEDLQLGLLTLFDRAELCDVTVVAGGRNIQAHKMVLASQSEWFRSQFAQPGVATVTLERNYKAVNAMLRFMYFGGLQDKTLQPVDGLDMLDLAEDLGVKALKENTDELAELILPRLTQQNCIETLLHEGLPKDQHILEQVCLFIGNNFLDMLNQPHMEDQLMNIPREYLAMIMRAACHYVDNDLRTKQVVQFCVNKLGLESACDLLRDTKQWDWSMGYETLLSACPQEQPEEGPEWSIRGVRPAMEQTPARIVKGNFFDWMVRLDYGAEGKLRIVYESATPLKETPLCINRFPAAMFAWKVTYQGKDVFHEKPVFICFPENVQLHWSTTLPITSEELTHDDEIKIRVTMSENPMLSLVLYHFSADLKKTVFDEDILNRLPHIEYRCLSSYSLVKAHS